jgi:hypothetical protein
MDVGVRGRLESHIWRLKRMRHTLVHVKLDVKHRNRSLSFVVVLHNTVNGFRDVFHDQI